MVLFWVTRGFLLGHHLGRLLGHNLGRLLGHHLGRLLGHSSFGAKLFGQRIYPLTFAPADLSAHVCATVAPLGVPGRGIQDATFEASFEATGTA